MSVSNYEFDVLGVRWPDGKENGFVLPDRKGAGLNAVDSDITRPGLRVVVGKNNSGKSRFLRFCSARSLLLLIRRPPPELGNLPPFHAVYDPHKRFKVLEPINHNSAVLYPISTIEMRLNNYAAQHSSFPEIRQTSFVPADRFISAQFDIGSAADLQLNKQFWPQYLFDLKMSRIPDTWQKIKDSFQRVSGLDVELHSKGVDGEIVIRELKHGTPRRLDECGDGLRDLLAVLLHVYAKRTDDLFIEEPGTRLHPSAQRVLLSVLEEEATTREIWIATHDPVFANAHAAVERFAVRREGDISVVSRVTTWNELQKQRDELGWAPSDALLASHVIYCEGPSDKLIFKEALSELEVDDARFGGVVVTALDGCGVVKSKNKKLLESVLERVRGTAPFAAHVVIIDDDYEPRASHEHRVAKLNASLRWLENAHELEDYFLHPALLERILLDAHRRVSLHHENPEPLPALEVVRAAIASQLEAAQNAVSHYLATPQEERAQKPTAVLRAIKPLWKKFKLGDFNKEHGARVAALHMRTDDPTRWALIKEQLRHAVAFK